MFDKDYETRLRDWAEFRNELEQAEDPLQLALEKFSQAPEVTIQTDPWDRNSWPSPWELVNENQYCDFCKILGICYSLQLTTRFSGDTFEIHISVDREKGAEYFLLFVDENVVGYDAEASVHKTKLPSTLESQTVYVMEPFN